MAAYFDDWRNALVEHYLRISTISLPTTINVGLSTTQPNPDGTGITPPTGGYAVVPTTPAQWAQGATSRQYRNDAVITFGPATALWGQIQSYVLTNQVGGLLAFGAVTNTPTIDDGDTAFFNLGALILEIQNEAQDLDNSTASDFTANEMLKSTFGVTPLYTPSSTFVGVTSQDRANAGDIVESDNGTTVQAKEPPTGDGYARTEFTNWLRTAAGTGQNNAEILIGPAANNNWGNVQDTLITDDATAGQILFYGDVVTSRPVNIGESARFGPNSLTTIIN